MLESLNREGRGRTRTSFVVSFCVHLAVIAVLLYRPAPKILKHEASLRGNGGNAVALIVSGYSILQAPEPDRQEQEPRTKETVFARKQAHKPKPPEQPKLQPATTDRPLSPGMPGYMLGSLTSGFILNHDVKVALPVIAPDPPIVRAKLPEWVRGDVIVEVTIDEEGHVIETMVLKTVGYGLEQTIIETLRNWHFTPAMVDGIKVASKQDVHFHFPS